MIDIALQIKGASLVPFSVEDRDKLREFQPNQVLRAKITGAKKARSYRQLKGYFAACQTVADNNDKPGWQTKEQVDFQCRVALRFYDPDLVIALPDGSIAFQYRSISYANLGHIEANDYFDKALEFMANFLGITKDELLRNANG